jgi:predicted nucleic acid-binding protein
MQEHQLERGCKESLRRNHTQRGNAMRRGENQETESRQQARMGRREGDTEVERLSEIVLDSSVVVKWFSKEGKSVEALAILDSYVHGEIELTASEILFCEVGNALRYKPDYDSDKLTDALLQLFSLHMKVTHLTEGLMKRAGEIAYDAKVTLYDALPVAIAEHKKAVCITADEATQYRKLHTKGYPIQLL